MQKEEYERRMSDLKSTERNFEERSETLINREKLLKDNEEKHAQRIKESTHALQEAKRVEREHELRMSELHAQSDEVTSQRQLLAEERKILVKGRLESQRCNVSAKSNPQASPAVLYDLTPTKLHCSDLGISASSYTTHVDVVTNPETVLWNHTAEQDQNYLEDEKFFLEALKHTPYSATKS
uniref:Fas-binding factor 1 C-terminal domain-containing protein n=1 Tax=Ciona savignyi TaxID=51511 RepID=H2Y873_CIOSA